MTSAQAVHWDAVKIPAWTWKGTKMTEVSLEKVVLGRRQTSSCLIESMRKR